MKTNFHHEVCLFICYFALIIIGAHAQDKPSFPWGEISATPIFLEADDARLNLLAVPTAQTKWIFDLPSLALIQAFLKDSGMPSNSITEATQNHTVLATGSGIELAPSRSLIESIHPRTRAKIYRELRKHAGNRYHIDPVIIESGNVEHWFSGCNLAPETLTRINSLTYSIDHLTAFSDIPILISYTQTEREESALLKATYRSRSYALSVTLSNQQRSKELTSYWTAEGLNPGPGALIESFLSDPTPNQIDLLQLLPPIPRKLLHTYPNPSYAISGVYPDSFWMVLNFFKEKPDNSFNEASAIQTEIGKRYHLINESFQFGDILMAVETETETVLSAGVYLADNFIYTKEGRSILKPFVLAKMDQWQKRQGIDRQVRVDVWRVNRPALPFGTGILERNKAMEPSIQ